MEGECGSARRPAHHRHECFLTTTGGDSWPTTLVVRDGAGDRQFDLRSGARAAAPRQAPAGAIRAFANAGQAPMALTSRSHDFFIDANAVVADGQNECVRAVVE